MNITARFIVPIGLKSGFQVRAWNKIGVSYFNLPEGLKYHSEPMFAQPIWGLF